ncbi:class I SAM-dependent methyltransferase [Candidatus Odyssella acanthamoebae]|uniref:class I SAM-dependent methyltransferase n=1 Tax=Candidatus Odyssella acanthamoebae TaxID=91604 RepID=UPI00068D5ED1|nr:class I SAM-dependent methyltransferase [Candidatus Paracaedibacter acanthamoebae]
MTINPVKKFYDQSYNQHGFEAQRKYPNEELCRFMGRNFFSVPFHERKEKKILEVGCGSGANLWMIAREGFDTYGIDLSEQALELCQKMLESYSVSAMLDTQDMENLLFEDNFFAGVVDVFSSYCLTKQEHQNFLQHIQRILTPNGLFFSYFPSKKSDAFTHSGNANFVDKETLSGIVRPSSPFLGQNYNFRFMHPEEYKENLINCGFQVSYLETIHRSYHNQTEQFEFIVVEARKIP